MMTTNTSTPSTHPKVTYLKDYKPSDFEIPSIDLSVDIYDEFTLIESHLKIKKGAHLSVGFHNLELQGEAMELLEISFNGVILPHERYQVSGDKLVIFKIQEESFDLRIKNKIYPTENKALEGFYQSGPGLCTQCEPEGFRRITYFIDRPDVMSTYRTRMMADKNKYPYLLSNGNRVGGGDLDSHRHWAQWEDPFRKPSYLFAMVAGDFDVARDTFTTRSKRRVDLEIYVDRGNLFKTEHAMNSLKESMKWDEKTYGLEYDLELYMIVAVDSFNMGAMENKGLNIFNSSFVLAHKETATDQDFQHIQGVIGHEYFHNWTGNRVTCRDWFQLTLKEGLTVFRDQEFSSDMLSRPVKRLEDVRLLKDFQFPEDQGPLSHPIRPSSYIEINNFYTRTVYEKGAEVIRMIETLIGKENFRKGMDEYFRLFDGKAVTTEDFVSAMESASQMDLSQFKNWYDLPGTPTLVVRSRTEGEDFILDIEQVYPSQLSLKNAPQKVLHMPFIVGLVDEEKGVVLEKKLELKKMQESFRFKKSHRVIPSLNRGFSSPVEVDYPYSIKELMLLMARDDDFYTKYDATQKIYEHFLTAELSHYQSEGSYPAELDPDLKLSFESILLDQKMDLSYKSYLLELPTPQVMSQKMSEPDFSGLEGAYRHLKKKLGLSFKKWFLSTHEKLGQNKSFELTPHAFGERALRNQCLSYIVAAGVPEGERVLLEHFFKASNMTEEIHGLQQFILSGVSLEHEALQYFYHRWSKDSLVMQKWFSSLASLTPHPEALQRVKKLEKDPLFLSQVPNYLRSLYIAFSKTNLVSFHAPGGEGYAFVADKILEIDRFNPQVASRLAGAFSLFKKLDSNRQSHMRTTLETLMKGGLSKDTFEVVSKYLH